MTHFLIYLHTLYMRRNESWPDRWSGFFCGFCFAAILTLLMHSLVLPQIFGKGIHEISTVPLWKRPLWALFEFVRAMEIGFVGRLVAIMAFSVFMIGFVSYFRTKPEVPVLLILPALLCGAVVVGMGHHLWPRLFFFVFGFAALIAIRGAMRIGEGMVRLLKLSDSWSIAAGTVIGGALIFASALSVPFCYGPKQDFLGALQYVEAERKPGDAVVTVGLASLTYKNYFHTDWIEVRTLEGLNTIRSGANRTWLIYTFPPEAQSVYPDVMASVRNDFKIQKEFRSTVGSGEIYVCLAPVIGQATEMHKITTMPMRN